MLALRAAFVLVFHGLLLAQAHSQLLFQQSDNYDELLDFSTTQKPQDTLELSSLSSERFTRLSHPYFPRHSARIKKSNFCDETVQRVFQ